MKAMRLISSVVLVLASVMAVSCSNKKNLAKENYRPNVDSLFEDVNDAPCIDYDTDDYYVGLGIASGAKARMGELQTVALTNAQNIVRQKLQHTYRGAIDSYSNYVGNNNGPDLEDKVERAGTQLIDKIVNDTRATCGPRFSGVDEKGDVTCYVGVRVYKKDFVETVTKHLSDNKDLKIRFKEDEFRKRMDANFEKYKEGR